MTKRKHLRRSARWLRTRGPYLFTGFIVGLLIWSLVSITLQVTIPSCFLSETNPNGTVDCWHLFDGAYK